MTFSRFLSRSAEAALPIFRTLKRGDSFTWTGESEEAFLRLKALLDAPPILMKPTPRIPLLVYISVAEEAVRSREKIAENRKGNPHPGRDIAETAPLLSRACGGSTDGSPD
ncbi:hypothetical protein CR513_01213, partial [Mucuna pruriens]